MTEVIELLGLYMRTHGDSDRAAIQQRINAEPTVDLRAALTTKVENEYDALDEYFMPTGSRLRCIVQALALKTDIPQPVTDLMRVLLERATTVKQDTRRFYDMKYKIWCYMWGGRIGSYGASVPFDRFLFFRLKIEDCAALAAVWEGFTFDWHDFDLKMPGMYNRDSCTYQLAEFWSWLCEVKPEPMKTNEERDDTIYRAIVTEHPTLTSNPYLRNELAGFIKRRRADEYSLQIGPETSGESRKRKNPSMYVMDKINETGGFNSTDVVYCAMITEYRSLIDNPYLRNEIPRFIKRRHADMSV